MENLLDNQDVWQIYDNEKLMGRQRSAREHLEDSCSLETSKHIWEKNFSMAGLPFGWLLFFCHHFIWTCLFPKKLRKNPSISHPHFILTTSWRNGFIRESLFIFQGSVWFSGNSNQGLPFHRPVRYLLHNITFVHRVFFYFACRGIQHEKTGGRSD